MIHIARESTTKSSIDGTPLDFAANRKIRRENSNMMIKYSLEITLIEQYRKEQSTSS